MAHLLQSSFKDKLDERRRSADPHHFFYMKPAFRDHVQLIGPTILFFDHLLTMADEIHFVWRKPKRFSFFIFVALRYVSLLSNIGMLALRYVPMPLESCHASALSLALLILQCLIVANCATTAILGLRVYVMYNYSKIVLLFLITTVLTATILAAWSITGETWVASTQLSSCDYPVSKERNGGWVGSTVRSVSACLQSPHLSSFASRFFCDLTVFIFTVSPAPSLPTWSDVLRPTEEIMPISVLALANLGNVLMYYPWIASSLSWFTST
ncbi:hypothetical protein C8R45DRAFT_935463 [Mycena sanguinolenta]|nr:hypothetical protein C8R45DRAFT_935463 [Mycena sanguinolenta]